MQIKVYSHKKCSTCRKALDYLNKQGIEYTVIDIQENAPTLKELQKMHSLGTPLKKLFNSSGLIYKKLNLKDKVASMKPLEVFRLLSNEGMLVKRPFLIGENLGLVGFKEAEWNEAISRSKKVL